MEQKQNKNERLIHQVKWVYGDNHFGEIRMFDRIYHKYFDTKEDYMAESVKIFNQAVNDDDVVLFLGDLGRLEYAKDIIPMMNGRKVLIKGNHDSFTSEYAMDVMGFEEVYDTPVWYNNRVVFSHIPIPVEPGVLNVHGHTHMIKLKSDWHVNLCPEWWDFRPVSINYILRKYVHNRPKPSYKFLQEWFKDIQISYQDDADTRFDLREDGTIIREKIED